MRYLLLPACLCLLTIPGSTGPDLGLDRISETNAGKKVFARATDAPAEAASPSYSTAAEVVPEPVPLPPIAKPVVARSKREICETLVEAAHSNDLPIPFFIHLIFRESGFRPELVSSAGAQGIAQFMPETAATVGLDNPFDPIPAIAASARLLRDLARQFGNLGLAAAAYNAGPRRIQDWLANKGKLPDETQNYVKTITGRAAETWSAAEQGSPAVKLPRGAPCQEAAGLLAWNGPDQIPLPPVRNARPPAATSVAAAMIATRARIKAAHLGAQKTAVLAAEKASARNDPKGRARPAAKQDKDAKDAKGAKGRKGAVQLAATSKKKPVKVRVSQR